MIVRFSDAMRIVIVAVVSLTLTASVAQPSRTLVGLGDPVDAASAPLGDCIVDDDQDGVCSGADCDDSNPHCAVDCTDTDGAGYCYVQDICVDVPRSRARIKLNDLLQPDILAFRLSPDATSVVYQAQGGLGQDLYSVPISGGQSIQLVAGYWVDEEFEVSPDGATVVFVDQLETEGMHELYSVPIEGGAWIKLNGQLPESGNVFGFVLSPDSTRVVYRADQDVEGTYDLYSVPIGGGPVVKLSGPWTADGDVREDFTVSPDGSTVVYRATMETPGNVELYSVAIGGGAVTKLNGPLTATGDVASFSISSDSSLVVYKAGQTSGDGLYSVPLGGGAFNPLSEGLQSHGYRLSPDGEIVVFSGGPLEAKRLYSVPIGGGVPAEISGSFVDGGQVSGFIVSPDNTRVVYRADQEVDGKRELYSVPIAGGVVTNLSGLSDPYSHICDFHVSPNGLFAVYKAESCQSCLPCYSGPGASTLLGLYSVPVGGGTSTKLNPPPVAGGRLYSQLLTPDSRFVIYKADQDIQSHDELYIVPITGGLVTKLNRDFVHGDVPSNRFDVDANGMFVVYIADQTVDEVFELHSTALLELDLDGDDLGGHCDCDDSAVGCGEDCVDLDGDGLTVCAGDCDDGAPGCTVDCTDADQDGLCFPVDCDDLAAACGTDCMDPDGDGLRACAGDCDATNPYCAADCTDADGDGVCVTSDCDETDPLCGIDCSDADGDGLCFDADCDPEHPACTTECIDSDNDGLTVCAGDCDDSNYFCELDCTDADGDGLCVPADCNDNYSQCTISGCVDPDQDGVPSCADCHDTNPYCTTDCTDLDADGFCILVDCDDGDPACSVDCLDSDGEGTCNDADCNDSNPDCNGDCTDPDGDGFCGDIDCNPVNSKCTTDCTDQDQDQWCITTDCDDSNGGVWSTPTTARSLALQHLVGITQLAWDPPLISGAHSVRYDVLRSTLASDFVVGADCLATNVTAESAEDDLDPDPGSVFNYLIRVENECPGDPGTLGASSDGTPRTGLPCS